MMPTDSDTNKIVDGKKKRNEERHKSDEGEDEETKEVHKSNEGDEEGDGDEEGEEKMHESKEENKSNEGDEIKDIEDELNGESKDETKDNNKDENKDNNKDENTDENTDENKDETKDNNKDNKKDENTDENKDQTKDDTKDNTKDNIKVNHLLNTKEEKGDGKLKETGIFKTKPSDSIDDEETKVKEEVTNAIFKAKVCLYRYKHETKEYISFGSSMLYITKVNETNLYKVMGVRINANRLGCNHYILPWEEITKHLTPKTWMWTTTTNSTEMGSKLGPEQMFCAKFGNEEDFDLFAEKHKMASVDNEKVLNAGATIKNN